MNLHETEARWYERAGRADDQEFSCPSGFDSWVLTCSDGTGHRRILKLIPDGRSARAQAETLLVWKRLGASRCVGLVAFDEKDQAILLERIEPGGDGTTLADVRRATGEAAAILTDLHRPAPKDLRLPSLTDKMAGTSSTSESGWSGAP